MTRHTGPRGGLRLSVAGLVPVSWPRIRTPLAGSRRRPPRPTAAAPRRLGRPELVLLQALPAESGARPPYALSASLRGGRRRDLSGPGRHQVRPRRRGPDRHRPRLSRSRRPGHRHGRGRIGVGPVGPAGRPVPGVVPRWPLASAASPISIRRPVRPPRRPVLRHGTPLISYPPWWRGRRRPEPASDRRRGLSQDRPDPGAVVRPDASDSRRRPIRSAVAAGGTVEMTIDPPGVAVLGATVPTLADRIAIGQRIAQTPGVSEVVNLLTVATARTHRRPAGRPPPPPPEPVTRTSRRPVAEPGREPAADDADRPTAAGSPIAVDGDATRSDWSQALADGPRSPACRSRSRSSDGVATLAGRRAHRLRGDARLPGRPADARRPRGGRSPRIRRARRRGQEPPPPAREARGRRALPDGADPPPGRRPGPRGPSPLQGDTLEIQGTLARDDDQAAARRDPPLDARAPRIPPRAAVRRRMSQAAPLEPPASPISGRVASRPGPASPFRNSASSYADGIRSRR